MAQMRSDIDLKKRQVLWETPKGIAAMAAAIAVVVGAIAGVLGYQIGRTPQHIIRLPPGSTLTVSPAVQAPAPK